ncbi:hypothetical protein E4K72_18875 [Oxalobacteraceae bacterium OM1]|nr:hypothetical protein E4K72_18875 [Oxalobacteraceae bacterium OM1]
MFRRLALVGALSFSVVLPHAVAHEGWLYAQPAAPAIAPSPFPYGAPPSAFAPTPTMNATMPPSSRQGPPAATLFADPYFYGNVPQPAQAQPYRHPHHGRDDQWQRERNR